MKGWVKYSSADTLWTNLDNHVDYLCYSPVVTDKGCVLVAIPGFFCRRRRGVIFEILEVVYFQQIFGAMLTRHIRHYIEKWLIFFHGIIRLIIN